MRHKFPKSQNSTAVSLDQITSWAQRNVDRNDVKDWLDSRRVHPELASKWAQSFSMSLFLFVPILGIVTTIMLKESVVEKLVRN